MNNNQIEEPSKVTIRWDGLKPEERDRIVCEAVRIHPFRKSWAVIALTTDGTWTDVVVKCPSEEWAAKRLAKVMIGRGYEKWDIVKRVEHPAVSTDANEALLVIETIHSVFRCDIHLRSGNVEFLASFESGQWALGNSFCHVICIAALRAKGVRVIL